MLCHKKEYYAYKWYGARGIKVCDEWVNNVSAFIEWSLANGYKKGLSLDRIDNDGDYKPSNCQWISLAENGAKNRRVRYITHNGQTLNLRDWSIKLGGSLTLVFERLKSGWSEEDAVSIPIRQDIRHSNQ